ncbi:sulfotransferase family protein [Saccharobesus litoralis]|uniref:Sulfotransferase family protein n=1 Tax=Saccharobesus litoralis TaxID=2172099 RepID=A0A2S0VXD5_9ALTE|nr:sulfotransferase [Saccharobesus litoralis]AWB68886.1 sulfotransferase family protein [Saccharobesus litoralis]
MKFFIIGLPRTATTSVCVAALELGYKTAHTAYTQQALEQASVIADTPVFGQYPLLDQAFSNSRFIYLQRKLESWLPSIQQLLIRMHDNVINNRGGFNPHIKQNFKQVFSPFTLANIQNEDFLATCYTKHQQAVKSYFSARPNDLLTIDVTEKDSYQAFCQFILAKPTKDQLIQGFKPINMAGKVTAWNQIKHPLKIASTDQGKCTLPFPLAIDNRNIV